MDKMSINGESDGNFFYRFRVRYSETDAQKVVFNAHYLTYFDTAITEYMRWIEFDYQGYANESGQDFHTVRVEIDFLNPSHFDDIIRVYVRPGKIGRSSLTFDMEIVPEDGIAPVVKGKVVWVNTDQKLNKSTPLPQELLRLIN